MADGVREALLDQVGVAVLEQPVLYLPDTSQRSRRRQHLFWGDAPFEVAFQLCAVPVVPYRIGKARCSIRCTVH